MRVMRVIAFLVLLVLGFGYLYSAGIFTAISFPGASYSEPTGINKNGGIVGVDCMSSCQDFQGFAYSAGVFSTINTPGAVDTRLWGINDSGEIVGAPFDGTSSSSFLYSGGAFTTINVPGVDNVSVSGINDSGETVGAIGSSTSAGGFLYGGWHLDPDQFTKTKDTNNNKQIVGTFENPPSPAPEPATMTLLCSGMMGLLGMLRRRNRRT